MSDEGRAIAPSSEEARSARPRERARSCPLAQNKRASDAGSIPAASIGFVGGHEDSVEDPLRRASARSSAPSLIVRTASASPSLEFPERVDAARDGRAELIGKSRATEGGAVSPAGASTMVASIFKSGMPSKRARTQASTRTPSERRFPGSGTTLSAPGAAVLDDLGIARARAALRIRNHDPRCAAGTRRCRRFRP
jgi:hypothetical protein